MDTSAATSRILGLGFIAALYPALTIIRQDILYVRYLLPVLPFIALLFGKAYDSSSEKSKKIAFVSLACLVLFSFAMTSVSAIFYNNVQQNNAPLYEFINSSNEFDSIISMHNSRALRYYTNKEVVTIGIGEYTIDWLTENHPSQYVAITCYNEDILTSIPGIVESEMTEIIFEEGCAKMLKVINN